MIKALKNELMIQGGCPNRNETYVLQILMNGVMSLL